MSAKRILLVDDSPTVLAELYPRLIDLGYEVRAVRSTFAIASAVAEFEPDLILMDVILAGSSGAQATRSLRGGSLGDGVVILLHSSLPPADVARKARECGADGFIAKMDPRRFEIIDRWLTGRRESEETVLSVEEMKQASAELAASKS